MKSLRLKTLLCILFIALGTVTRPNDAHALSFEGQGWVGTGAANIHQVAPTLAGWWGPALELGLVLNITDFWQLITDLSTSYHFERIVDDEAEGPYTVASAALGLRYTFDIFKYIPYAGISFVASPFGPPSESSPAGELWSIRATLGADYRYNRRISFGGAVQISAPLTEPQSFPLYSSIRAHIGFHFRKF